jgi:hypothetical protein
MGAARPRAGTRGLPPDAMKTIKHILGHLVSCKDVSHLLSRAPERPLGPFERIKVRWHLAVCQMCRSFERQLRFLQSAMRRYRE